MRIASFNVENLFSRARAMNLDTWSDGKQILAEYSRLNTRLQKPVYTAANKKAIVASLKKLGLNKSDESKCVILRENRGHLLKRPKSGPPAAVAKGRAESTSWLGLKTDAVHDRGVRTP